MEVSQVIRMVGGQGRTSYASNSLLQKKAIAKAKPLVQQTLADLYSSNILPERMAVADLGCSSGPNAVVVAGEIIEVIRETSCQLGRAPPEIQYFLNDLPGNDFNTLFRFVGSFQQKLIRDEEEGGGSSTAVPPLYVYAVAGSFYSRLFPNDSVHFVHSSYCLQFLSQVPPGVEFGEAGGNPRNGHNIHLSQTSPPVVRQSYWEQFQKDFTLFLKLRSEEIISGGCMVLVLLGRGTADPSNGECSHLFNLLADALNEMTLEGLIEEGKVDSFNLPFFFPSLEELKAVIYNEGSFDISQCEVFELNWDPTDDLLDDFVAENSKSGKNVAQCLRAVMEPMLIYHFGEAIIDDLFSRFAENIAMHLSKHKTKFINLSASLKKRATKRI